ncbi:MAG: hypothetical protein CMQ44_02585 [Gammaproteobacteria bacterium]|nr:hypothetical protein [Gammaproteobacteria bacterium]|tara:strand:- start:1605 stop:2468 length:864 start_codon:yes stop_codon:yes gene_type:complete
MPASVLFLISDHVSETASNDNHARLPTAFADCNWTVHIAAPERIMLNRDGPHVDGYAMRQADLIWPLGFGPRNGFLDRAHLLSQLPQEKMITPIAEQILAHGKAQWLEFCPPTYVSSDISHLQTVAKEQGGDWVLKPLAGSYGRDVHYVTSREQQLIGEIMQTRSGSYFALQRFVPAIIHGEIRTLVAGGKIIGSYRRQPLTGIRANLAAEGHATPVLDQDLDTDLINKVLADLQRRRIGYAAIDTVGGYLMEVNLANPGGLGTLCTIYQSDLGEQVVGAVASQHGL